MGQKFNLTASSCTSLSTSLPYPTDLELKNSEVGPLIAIIIDFAWCLGEERVYIWK
jgi:hypothetical protein